MMWVLLILRGLQRHVALVHFVLKKDVESIITFYLS